MTRQNVLSLALVVVLSILVLEGLVRVTQRGPRWLNPHYVAISSGYVELDGLIADTQNTHPAPKYHDEFIYAAAPVSTEHINFTDYYGARWTPDSVPLEEAELIVWTFGGSTMENTETADSLTIANTWARIFNEALGPTHVKNFGAGGFFSSYELIKFQKILREVPESEIPAIAIFYDGYNDAYFGFQYGPGRLQADLSLKLQSLVEHKNAVMWAYASSRILSKYSRLWERTGARLVEFSLFPSGEPDTGAANLEGAVRVYTRNVRMIQATCEAYGIQCFFVLQPLIVTKQPLSELEQDVLGELERHPRFGADGTRFIRDFYERVQQALSDNQGFVDASRILDGRTESDFYDLGHTGALTAPIIGELAAAMLLSRLGAFDAGESTSEHDWRSAD
jgi:hypothetical protein